MEPYITFAFIDSIVSQVSYVNRADSQREFELMNKFRNMMEYNPSYAKIDLDLAEKLDADPAVLNVLRNYFWNTVLEMDDDNPFLQELKNLMIVFRFTHDDLINNSIEYERRRKQEVKQHNEKATRINNQVAKQLKSEKKNSKRIHAESVIKSKFEKFIRSFEKALSMVNYEVEKLSSNDKIVFNILMDHNYIISSPDEICINKNTFSLMTYEDMETLFKTIKDNII